MEENKTMGASKTPEESSSEDHSEASTADVEGKVLAVNMHKKLALNPLHKTFRI